MDKTGDIEVVRFDLSSGEEFNVRRLLPSSRRSIPSAVQTSSTTSLGLESVIASLERRFASTVPLDDEEDREDDDLVDEDDKVDGVDLDVEGAGFIVDDVEKEENEEAEDGMEIVNNKNNKSTTSENEIEEPKEHQPKKRARSNRNRNLTKEEREWLDEGEDFLDEEEYVEQDEAVVERLTKALSHDGFYVHRGPLLSKERERALRKQVTDEQNRKMRREDNSNSTRKKKKKKDKKKDKKRRRRREKEGSAKNHAKDPEERSGEEKTSKSRKSSTNRKAEQDEIKEAVAKAASKVVAIRDRRQGMKREVAPEILSSLRVIDFALVPMLRTEAQMNSEMATAEIIQALSPLLSHYDTHDRVVLQLEKLRRLEKLRERQREAKTVLDSLIKYIKQRTETCSTCQHRSIKEWKQCLRDIDASNELEQLKRSEITLKQLYDLPSHPKGSENAEEKHESEWASVLELFDKVCMKLKESDHTQMRSIFAMCQGYLKRRAEGKGFFVWDSKGRALLERHFELYKGVAEKAVSVLQVEKQIYDNAKPSCRSRKGELAYLSSQWPDKQMTADELHVLVAPLFEGFTLDQDLQDDPNGFQQQSSKRKRQDGKSPSNKQQHAGEKRRKKASKKEGRDGWNTGKYGLLLSTHFEEFKFVKRDFDPKDSNDK